MPSTLAGPIVSARIAVASASRPAWTSASTRPSVVSRPTMPNGASAMPRAFSSAWCGAWSDAIAAIVPSARAARTAATSASVRSGGFILASVPWRSTASAVSMK